MTTFDERGREQKADQRGEQKGEQKKQTELVIEMHKDGITNNRIAKIAKISIERVEEIIKKHSNTERE